MNEGVKHERLRKLWRDTMKAISMLLVAACGASPAYAVPVTVHFTATGVELAWRKAGDPEKCYQGNAEISCSSIAFNPTPSVPVPQATVTGTIVYEAADTHSPIQSITSVDLTIGGHTYTTGELAFRSPYSVDGSFIVGGTKGGAEGTVPRDDISTNDDFYLTWSYPSGAGSPTGHHLVYIVDGVRYPGAQSHSQYAFWTTTFSSFTVTTP